MATKTVVCPKCNKSFANKSGLTSHMKRKVPCVAENMVLHQYAVGGKEGVVHDLGDITTDSLPANPKIDSNKKYSNVVINNIFKVEIHENIMFLLTNSDMKYRNILITCRGILDDLIKSNAPIEKFVLPENLNDN